MSTCTHTHTVSLIFLIPTASPFSKLRPTPADTRIHLVHSQSLPESCCHPLKPCSDNFRYDLGGEGAGSPMGEEETKREEDEVRSMMKHPADHALPQAPLPPFPARPVKAGHPPSLSPSHSYKRRSEQDPQFQGESRDPDTEHGRAGSLTQPCL